MARHLGRRELGKAAQVRLGDGRLCAAEDCWLLWEVPQARPADSGTDRAQYPLFKEYTLDHKRIPIWFKTYSLNKGFWAWAWAGDLVSESGF